MQSASSLAAPVSFPAVVALAVLIAGVLGLAASRVDLRRLEGDGAHRFWGCATGIAVLWHAAGGPVGDLHLLGATVACGLLGFPLGLLALAVGAVLRHGVDVLAWSDWPLAFACGALVPVALAGGVMAIARRRVRAAHGPCALVVGAFVAGAVSMAASIVLRAVAGLSPGTTTFDDPGTLAALVLAMAMAEANLSAALISAVAAQRPGWLDEPAGGPVSARSRA